MDEHIDTTVENLGPARFDSPLTLNAVAGDGIGNFVSDRDRVLDSAEIRDGETAARPSFEKAGPRQKIFFEPSRTRAAIVTCGGLCPGLNNVIRSAFRELHNYGVREVFGIRYGYQGLNPAAGALPPIRLTDDMVDHIHEHGGTILGSSRGNQPVPAMVDFLQKERIDILLTVGGDGTQRGSREIAAEATKRGMPLAAVGIPKTIDNDIMYVSRTFGYTTAIDKAREVLTAAHAEARSYPNGIGLVRLMGRDSGFIAAGASLASQEVNFVLIPEVPFALDGEGGLLQTLKRRLARKGHAVVVVAEGAGQDLMGIHSAHRDASGNILHKDIGPFLRERIMEFFKAAGIPVNMKYLDPSYLIRGIPANSDDSILCDLFARNAVHAAMAGKTNVIVGHQNTFIHVPTVLATQQRQKVNPEGVLWNSVLSATGQPVRMI